MAKKQKKPKKTITRYKEISLALSNSDLALSRVRACSPKQAQRWANDTAKRYADYQRQFDRKPKRHIEDTFKDVVITLSTSSCEIHPALHAISEHHGGCSAQAALFLAMQEVAFPLLPCLVSPTTATVWRDTRKAWAATTRFMLPDHKGDHFFRMPAADRWFLTGLASSLMISAAIQGRIPMPHPAYMLDYAFLYDAVVDFYIACVLRYARTLGCDAPNPIIREVKIKTPLSERLPTPYNAETRYDDLLDLQPWHTLSEIVGCFERWVLWVNYLGQPFISTINTAFDEDVKRAITTQRWKLFPFAGIFRNESPSHILPFRSIWAQTNELKGLTHREMVETWRKCAKNLKGPHQNYPVDAEIAAKVPELLTPIDFFMPQEGLKPLPIIY